MYGLGVLMPVLFAKGPLLVGLSVLVFSIPLLLVDVLLQVDQVDQVVKALMQMQLMSLA